MSDYLININDEELDLIVKGLGAIQDKSKGLSDESFKLKQHILLTVIAQIGPDTDFSDEN